MWLENVYLFIVYKMINADSHHHYTVPFQYSMRTYMYKNGTPPKSIALHLQISMVKKTMLINQPSSKNTITTTPRQRELLLACFKGRINQ